MIIRTENWFRQFNLLVFDEIDSTNEEAKRLANAGANGDFVIWAKTQTNGKGRYGKKWVSPHGNLYLSLLLQNRSITNNAYELSFVTAIALTKMLEYFLPSERFAEVKLKWPNDILIEGKKISGILLESCIKEMRAENSWIVIGVGLNIEQVISNELSYAITSLKNEGVSNLKPESLLDYFMKSFTYWFKLWSDVGFSVVRNEWLKYAMGIGENITVNMGNSKLCGMFEGLTHDGSIELLLSCGQKCFISSGEVFYDSQLHQKKFLDSRN